ncbi:hypothetical protein K0U00_24420, partial [Paenibacillus sepulcri]|nr:hypothetical protein [Paenibacillus sepulcri]
PMAVIAIFAALVAQWFKSSTTAIVVCIAVYAALKVLPLFLPEAAVWSPFAYTDWHELWLQPSVPVLRLMNIFVFISAYSIIGYTAGLFRFTGKSL